jgi:hypothetical protein
MSQAATKPAKRAATYADLVAASDLLIAEIIFGRLVTHRRGDPRHNSTLDMLLHAIAPVVWPESWRPQSWTDWACEVMSAETVRRDRGEKRIVYAKAGIRHLWLVDTMERTLEIFELKAGKWVLLNDFRDDAKVAAPPFAEVGFALNQLWHLYPPAAQDRCKAVAQP